MDYQKKYLIIIMAVLSFGFIIHAIYSNKMLVIQIMPKIQKQPRNVTTIERKTDPQGKCHLPFNCTNGANPPFEPTLKNMSFMDLKLLFPEVKQGGNWSPDDCDPGQRVAIIIPYRNREEHLKLLLANLIPFLKMQRKPFTIILVEQVGDVLFNRASLLNIGYVEALKLSNYSCFIFHDVDMIPIRLCNLYECYTSEAVHLGVSRNRNPPSISYKTNFGGVLSLHKSHMEKINGFSNVMFGWGAEDDEAYMRFKKEKIKTTQRLAIVGNYVMPEHIHDNGNPKSPRSIQQGHDHAKYRKTDGLSSLNYTLKDITQEALYTKIVVEIAGPRNMKEMNAYFANKGQN